jgi:iron complex outermembrane receptor protein
MTLEIGLKSILLSGAIALTVASPALAAPRQFRVPAGDLASALNAYAKQSGDQIIYSTEQVRNATTAGLEGKFERTVALDRLLRGTRFVVKRGPSGAVILERAAFRSQALGTAGLGSVPPRQLASTAPIMLAAAPDQALTPREKSMSNVSLVSDNDQMGTIVVTALRVETNLQQTPLQVSAFNNETLQTLSVENFFDITRLAPSVRFSSSGSVSSSVITMRGVSSVNIGASAGNSQGVLTYFNDFNVATLSQNAPSFDLANIQVLQGPQGTLFGGTSIGGAILINSVQPSFTQNGYIKASAGNYGYYGVEGAANLTLVPDVLAVRLGAQINKRDGYVKNTARSAGFTNSTLGSLADVDQQVYRASVLFEPSSILKNVLVYDYFRERDTGTAATPVNTATNPGYGASFYPGADAAARTAARTADLAVIAACNHLCVNYGNNNGVFQASDFHTLVNTTTLELSPETTFKNILGYSHRRSDTIISVDGSPGNISTVNSKSTEQYFSEEFQVIGQASERINYIAGLYYQKGDQPNAGSQRGIAWGSLYRPYHNTGLFLSVDTDLTRNLKLRTGVRYSWNETSIYNCAPPAGSPADTGAVGAAVCKARGEAAGPSGILKIRDKAPTWSLGLDWQATDDLFFYVTSRRGYRAGGANGAYAKPCSLGSTNTYNAAFNPLTQRLSPPPANNPTACVDFGYATTSVYNAAGVLVTPGTPSGRSINLNSLNNLRRETLTDIEIGVRTNWSIDDWRFKFNAQYFHYWYDNVAANFLLGNGPNSVATPGNAEFTTGQVLVNFFNVSADGVGADFSISPTRDLTLSGNVSYFSQKPAGIVPVPGFENVDVKKLYNLQFNLPTPEWSATANLNYVLPWKPLQGSLTFNYNYFYTAAFQARNVVLPSYDLHNVRLDWNDIGGKPLTLSVFANNLFDNRYVFASTAIDTVLGTAIYGKPRMFGVEASYKFR